MDLTQAIETRASIREFSESAVSDAEIEAIIAAACQAPSWANTQVWEFVVVRERTLIDAIVKTYSSTNPATKASLNAPALIVMCAKKQVSGYRDGQPLTIFDEWFLFDLGLACENLSLKAHDLGLGTVIVGLFDHLKVNDLLEVPASHTAVAILPIGWPAKPGKIGPAKKSGTSCSHRERFGQTWKAE